MLVIVALLGFLATHSLATPAQAVPQTITLSSRTIDRSSRFRARAISSSTIPLRDFFLGTDLQSVFYIFFISVLISVLAHSGGSETYQVLLFLHDFLSLSNILSVVSWDPASGINGQVPTINKTYYTFLTLVIQVVFDTGSSTLEFASR